MSNPKEGDDQVVKRIIRYLKGKPRVAIRYQFQEESESITVYTDSDWAGDEVTRRSGRRPAANFASRAGPVERTV